MRICIIYLVHGNELWDFADNSLKSLRASGIDVDVVIYHTENTQPPSADWLSSRNASASPVGSEVAPQLEGAAYSNYGTLTFNKVTSLKWSCILSTLDRGYDCVIYSDVDIFYIRNFTEFLAEATKLYKCGMQSESKPQFPPMYCTGFMFFTQDTTKFLQQLSEMNARETSHGNDQDFLNRLIRKNPRLTRDILVLPEGLFQNGLYYQTHGERTLPAMSGALSPYLFHANWCRGADGKRNLLRTLGMWRV